MFQLWCIRNFVTRPGYAMLSFLIFYPQFVKFEGILFPNPVFVHSLLG